MNADVFASKASRARECPDDDLAGWFGYFCVTNDSVVSGVVVNLRWDQGTDVPRSPEREPAAVEQKPENHRGKPEWRGLKAERLKK